MPLIEKVHLLTDLAFFQAATHGKGGGDIFCLPDNNRLGPESQWILGMSGKKLE